MTNLIKKDLTLDSREVAEMVEKRHGDLLRDIRTFSDYLSESKIALVDFFKESKYLDSKGEERPNYQITKKGCEFIAHKLTGQKGTLFTATYINKFHEMENILGGAKEISKSEKSSKVGGINGLVRTLNSIMKEEGLPAWKRAEVLKRIMEQYGLDIPKDFVSKPTYLQLSLTIPIGN